MFDAVRRHPVAVKSLPRLDLDDVYWLKSEFRALVDVRHRNLVELFDLVVDAESCFFSMEWIDGVDLDACARAVLGADRARTTEAAFERITPCLREVAEGIEAIHRCAKLHRDVKPSNVMVANDGRVVLLDYGLTTPLRALQSGDRSLSGTIVYMSPEELAGRPLGPAADWYSFGVVLYELLTGELPFDPVEAWSPDPRRAPLDPRTLAPGVPPRLAELALALVRTDAAARPGYPEIVARLAPEADASVPPPVVEVPAAFVGRSAELARLAAAFREIDDRVMSVHVRGESGIGKSTLIQQFCDRIAEDHGAVVLTSRCHPYESVPYKAFDALVDALAMHLGGRDVNVEPLLPPDVTELLQQFPALGRVPAIAAAAHERSTAWDPIESRRRGAKALKTLLGRLAIRRPVVIWIDDLQWGDADSAVVLRTLLGAPPISRVLVILSYREDGPMLAGLGGTPLESDPCARVTLARERLPPDDARTLAERLLGADERSAGLIAAQGDGSPFLIQQLAHHRHRHRVPPADEADIVRERVGALDAVDRDLLELACVAAADVPADVLLDAAGLPPRDASRLTWLRAESLLRLTPRADHETYQPYHDRIREAVVAGLGTERLRGHHAALAAALAGRSTPDPETLFRHYLGAGDVAAAAVHLEHAAARAAETLAFARAAMLWAIAVDLTPPGSRRVELLMREGEALQNAGRTADAGARFRTAAEHATAHAPERVHELERRAAECLLRSGHVDEGIELFWQVLAKLGIDRPRSDGAAFVRTLGLRMRFLVGPLDRTPVPGVTPLAEQHRLDAIWRASMNLTMARHAQGAYLAAIFIRLGLASKEPWVVARAVGWEGVLENTIGGRYFQRRAQRLLAKMDRIVERGLDDEMIAFAHAARGSCAWFDGDLREAHRQCTLAIEALHRCRFGTTWEETVSRAFVLHSLGFLGDMTALATELEAALEDATARGDIFAANFCRVGQQAFCHLAADDPARALALAGEAEASLPAGPYHTTHYHLLVSVAQAELYRGEPARAWAAVVREWPRLASVQLLRLVFPRAELGYLRGRVALALHGARADAHLLAEAKAAARRLRRTRTRPAPAFAAVLEASVARFRGDLDRARARLEAAVEGFRFAELRLHEAAAKWRLGELVGGEGGAALRRDAERRLAAETRRPEAIVATLLPT